MNFDGVTLKSLLEEDQKGKLVLPNFQRTFVWSKEAQRGLLASFVADVPVGSVLVLHGTERDFAARPLGFNTNVTPSYECKFLLDGQQRLASLKAVFTEPFGQGKDWERLLRDMFGVLRLRWFIRLEPGSEEDTDLFGWRDLSFDGSFPRYITPEDVRSLLLYKPINITQPHEWHHPYYQYHKFEGETEDQVRLRVGRQAAEDGLVPLWEVFQTVTAEDSKGYDPVHVYAIEDIARRKAVDLKAATKGSAGEMERILSSVQPDIADHLGDAGKVDAAWHRLEVRWAERVKDRLEKLLYTQIPLVEVARNQPERAIAIFENINLGGTPLTVFDLVVAKAALNERSEESLRRRIVEQLREEMTPPRAVTQELTGVPPTWSASDIGSHDEEGPEKRTRNQYLNALSMLGHLAYPSTDGLQVAHIKKAKQLALTSEEITAQSDNAVIALKRALFLTQARFGIGEVAELPYELMLLPLAHVCLDEDLWNDETAVAKMEYWYWACLFGGRYRERQNPRCIEDIKALCRWVREDGQNPFAWWGERVFDVEGYSDKETLLKVDDQQPDPPQAMRDGILQFVLSREPEDLLPQEGYPSVRLSAWRGAVNHQVEGENGLQYELGLQKHHIVPLASATRLGESAKTVRTMKAHPLNSPLNYTPISGTANRLIGGKAPEDYLAQLDDLSVGDHCIPQSMIKDTKRLRNERSSEMEARDYAEIIGNRYDELKRAVRQRLRELVPGSA